MTASWPADPAFPGRRCQPFTDRRRAACWLALLAVLLRVLVPAGFMPAPAAAGTPLALVLCTGQGIVTALVDATGAAVPLQDDGAGKSADRHPCPFAGGFGGGLAPPPPSPPLPAAFRPAAHRAGEPQCPDHVPAALPPPATAPPISA